MIAIALSAGAGGCAFGDSPRQASAPATIDRQAAYPEGPLFDGDDLLVAEMGADQVSRYTPQGVKTTAFFEPGCGPTAIAPYRDGFLVLCHLAGKVVAIDRSGAVHFGARRTVNGPLRDPNDGASDRRGGVYFSDPGRFSKDAPVEGAVVYLSPSGELKRVVEGLWYPNGVYVDAQGRWAYVSEHMAGMVWRYRIGEGGALDNRELVLDVRPYLGGARYREAGPDGLEIGPDGRLVVALYGEGKLLSIPLDRAGQARIDGVREIRTPMAYVTNIAFSATGRAVTVGPVDNINPPFTGYVMALPESVPAVRR